jgi:hypothetical protein
MMVLRITAIASFLVAINLHGQKIDSVLNLEDSPAILAGDANDYFTLRNRSEKQIVSVTLGCVARQGQESFVVHKWLPQTYTIDPKQSARRGMFDPSYTEEFTECVKRPKVKMAVIHVDFVDGSDWGTKLAERLAEDWVANLEDTPLTLEPTLQRGAYTLRNVSGKKIISYTFACVDMNGEVPTIVHKLPLEQSAIRPGGRAEVGIMDAPYTLEYAQCVHLRKVKMAVIHVNFEDGNNWSAKHVELREDSVKSIFE